MLLVKKNNFKALKKIIKIHKHTLNRDQQVQKNLLLTSSKANNKKMKKKRKDKEGNNLSKK